MTCWKICGCMAGWPVPRRSRSPTRSVTVRSVSCPKKALFPITKRQRVLFHKRTAARALARVVPDVDAVSERNGTADFERHPFEPFHAYRRQPYEHGFECGWFLFRFAEPRALKIPGQLQPGIRYSRADDGVENLP